MIITCNCGLKKFSLPDNLYSDGIWVQCGSCGLKWKHFNETKEIKVDKKLALQKKKL